jgi:hypothetical protein
MLLCAHFPEYVLLIAGFIQVFTFHFKQCKRLHRVMGYVYIINVIFLSDPSGKQKIPLRLAQGDLLKVFKFSLTSKE